MDAMEGSLPRVSFQRAPTQEGVWSGGGAEGAGPHGTQLLNPTRAVETAAGRPRNNATQENQPREAAAARGCQPHGDVPPGPFLPSRPSPPLAGVRGRLCPVGGERLAWEGAGGPALALRAQAWARPGEETRFKLEWNLGFKITLNWSYVFMKTGLGSLFSGSDRKSYGTQVR